MAKIRSTGKISRRGLYTPKPSGDLLSYSLGKKKSNTGTKGFAQNKSTLKSKTQHSYKKGYEIKPFNATVTPIMVGKTLAVRTGNTFTKVTVNAHMLGSKLGEFTPLTQRKIKK
jgi:ribosomal protein S19